MIILLYRIHIHFNRNNSLTKKKNIWKFYNFIDKVKRIIDNIMNKGCNLNIFIIFDIF